MEGPDSFTHTSFPTHSSRGYRSTPTVDTEHHGDKTGAIRRVPRDLFPPMHRVLVEVERNIRKKPSPAAPGLLSHPLYTPASGVVLGQDYGAIMFVFRAQINGGFSPGAQVNPCENETNSPLAWVPIRTSDALSCLSILLSQRLNTPVPLNINPGIWFKNTALTWMCFLASFSIKRLIFRIKFTHNSFFTIPLL